ncbi:MAG: PilN domain-containing protein [Magnetococcus sp. MYC-9]
MVRQRVNFFQERFRPQRSLLSLRSLLVWWLLLVLLLGAVTMGLRLFLANRQAEWQRLAGQGAGEAEAAAWRRCRTDWEQWLATEPRWSAVPVAPWLERLASQHREGIWLTRIEIAQEGTLVSIQGNALSSMAEQLPHYLQTLARQPLLPGGDVLDFQLEKEPVPMVQGGGASRMGSLLKFRAILGREGSAPQISPPRTGH